MTTAVITVDTSKPHDFLIISYTPAFINSWDAPDFLAFYVNYEPIYTTRRVDGRSIPFGNCVNEGWQNKFDTTYPAYFAVIPHSDKTVTLSWMDTLDEDKGNEAWGLAGVSVFTVSQDFNSGRFA
jgi:hypothetical protein